MIQRLSHFCACCIGLEASFATAHLTAAEMYRVSEHAFFLWDRSPLLSAGAMLMLYALESNILRCSHISMISRQPGVVLGAVCVSVLEVKDTTEAMSKEYE
jgi:hypothetical protein